MQERERERERGREGRREGGREEERKREGDKKRERGRETRREKEGGREEERMREGEKRERGRERRREKEGGRVREGSSREKEEKVSGRKIEGERKKHLLNCFHSLHSYEVIQECWNERPEQRPTFNNLYRTFDSFLSKNTQESYPYIELLGQEDAGKEPETPQLDRTPVNLDPEVAHTNGNAASLKMSRSTEILHQFLSSAEPSSSLQIKSSSTDDVHMSARRSSTLPVEMFQQPLSWKERKKIFNEGMEMKTRYVELSHGSLARGAPPLPETLLRVHNQDQRN